MKKYRRSSIAAVICVLALALAALPAAAGAASDGSAKLNINTATVDELVALPGIGTAKAQAIVDRRDETGHFASVEDLLSVPGVGKGVLGRISDQVFAGPAK